MFILNGFVTLRESYLFYFTSILILSLSVIITVGRCYQALYRDKIHKVGYALMEATVHIIRIFQYGLIICLAADLPISAFNSTRLWDPIFLSLNELTIPDLAWKFFGFVIVFGIYNLILYLVFNKASIAEFIKKRELSRFSVDAIQLALILGFKNLLLIPVSFIYILISLNII